MALVQRKISNKKQATLALALAGVLLITGLVAYFGIFKEPTGSPVPFSGSAGSSGGASVPSVRSGGLESIKELSDSPVFQKLQKFGSWPLATEPRGKSQPFNTPLE